MTVLQNPYSHTYANVQRAMVDLSLSENPLEPSPKAIEAIVKAAGKSHFYPNEEKALMALGKGRHQIATDAILLGAGANQLIEDYLKVFA